LLIISFVDQSQNPTILNLTEQLIPVFASVLGEPKEQLEDSIRAKVIDIIKFIHSKNANLVESNETLVAALRG